MAAADERQGLAIPPDASGNAAAMRTVAGPAPEPGAGSVPPNRARGDGLPRGEGTHRILVVLKEPSVAEQMGEEIGRARALAAGGEMGGAAALDAATARRQALTAQLQRTQAAVAGRLQVQGVSVVHRFVSAVNVLVVEARPDQYAAIAAQPEVARLAPNTVYPHPGRQLDGLRLQAACTPLSSAQSTTRADLLNYHGIAPLHARGINGQGVVVAVLDDGVDYTHARLGGTGTLAQLNAARAAINETNPARIRSVAGFPNAVVIGGADMLSANDTDRLTPGLPNPFPTETTVNPYTGQACDSYIDLHGTHVTDIIRTVAPQAKFLAYRVCMAELGCPTDAVLAAVERLVDPNRDGLTDDMPQVVNLSLGSEFGDPDNLMARALQGLSAQGVTVVASAGNSGSTPGIVGSPAVAPKLIAVAELVGPAERTARGWPALDVMAWTSSSGPALRDLGIRPHVGAVGNVVSARAGGLTTDEGFGGTSGAAPVVAGVAALIKQHRPALRPQEVRARIVNAAKPGVAWGRGVDTIATAGTRDLYRFLLGTPDFTRAAGTVTGDSAYGLQVAPATPVSVYRVGGGVLRADAALAQGDVSLYALDDPRDYRDAQLDPTPNLPAGLNFGIVHAVGRAEDAFLRSQAGFSFTALPRQLVIRNTGTTARTFTLGTEYTEPAKQASGAVTLSFSPASVTVPAGGQQIVQVRVNIAADKLPARRTLWRYRAALGGAQLTAADEDVPKPYRDDCSPWDPVGLREVVFDGYVVASEGAQRVRLPWQVFPYRSADAGVRLLRSGQLPANGTGTGATWLFPVRPTSPDATVWRVYPDARFTNALENNRIDAISTIRPRGLPWLEMIGARVITYNVTSAEVSGGLTPSEPARPRRAIEVALVFDNNRSLNDLLTYFSPDGLSNPELGDVFAFGWGLKLGIDVNGDKTCGLTGVQPALTAGGRLVLAAPPAGATGQPATGPGDAEVTLVQAPVKTTQTALATGDRDARAT